MVFSSRTPADLTPNRLTRALAAVRAEGREVIDLTESNPTRAGFTYPADLLEQLADPQALEYRPAPFGAVEARAAIARDYERRGHEIGADRLVLTGSTSEAYASLFKILADPGDDVLVPRPSYPLFDHLARLEGIVPRFYDLEPGAAWRVDFDALEQAIGPRTRAILGVSPNNPTGTFLKADESGRLVELAAAHDVALIVDEVFADYELIPGARAAAGHLLGWPEALAFSLGGLSKSVGLPQVKLAWIAASGPDRLVAAAMERLEVVCDTFLSVSTPVQIAAPVLLERGATIREQIARRVVLNYRTLLELATAAPACRVLPSEGGWYAVLEIPALGPEEALVVDLLERRSVLVHPGFFFDFPREAFVVVSLLADPARFAEGAGRLLRHCDCSAGSRA
jgi:aspartate/methionine/tyrosine aminotransferase